MLAQHVESGGKIMSKKVFAAVALVALIATGCGKTTVTGATKPGDTPASEAKGDPQSLVAGFAERARDEKSAKFSMSVASGAGGQSFSFTADGVIDFKKQVGSMTIDLGDALKSAPSSAGIPTEFDMVFGNGVVYIKGGFGQKLPEGKTWLKVDSKSGGLFGSSGDPTAFFDQLKGVAGDIKVEGTETIRGTSTTKYSASIDTEKAIAAAPAASREVIRKGFEGLPATTLPVTVWAGDDGLLRKMSFEIKTKDITASTAFELYDYGTAVSVTLPSPAEVYEKK